MVWTKIVEDNGGVKSTASEYILSIYS